MIDYMTAGESHGPQLTVILEGLPAGLALTEELIRADLARRQIALGAGGRMAIETDRALLTGGVLGGRTTGAPVSMTIANANHVAWRGKAVAAYTVPRPGHADFAAVVKYGYDDIRPALERASARETASRVAAGACCRALLGEFGIEVKGTYDVAGDIEQARRDGETLGGVIEVVATGLPVGLGSHVSARRRLDARLAAAAMSIPAIKGVEIGDGFALARMKGTETRGRMGGLAGGISDGTPLVVRVAMKPIPTTLKKQPTVDLATGEPAETVYERSDVCPVPRAVVVVEAAVCLVLADALAEKLGGDSLEEMKARFARLPRTRQLSSEPKVFWP
ncbi:MAG: chorismate synthase [Kiritimatiellia bacterium]